MVAMAYVADCHTFDREINLELFNVDQERDKMVDLFLRMLSLQ